MTVLVTWELPIKSGLWDEACKICADLLPDTRNFPGCQSIDIYHGKEDNVMLLVEFWNSTDDYEKYFQWRKETGVMGNYVTDFGAGEAVLRIFDPVES